MEYLPRDREAQGVDQRLVLRHVVRGPPDEAVEAAQLGAVAGPDVDAEAGIARVAPAGPVDVDVECDLPTAHGSTATVGAGGS